MSSRDVLLRRSALSALLNNYSSRLSSLEKRSRWPGATQFVSAPTKVLTVPLTPTVTWETVASITLDPGRWLLIGQGSFATSDISGAQIETLLRLAGDNAASSREAFPYNSLVSVRPFYQIQCTVQSQGQTYLLEAAQNSTNNFLPGFRYGEVRGGSIIAYPL